jgi:L-malate glycosyltransferase
LAAGGGVGYSYLGAPAFRSYPLAAMAKILEFPLLALAIIRKNPDVIYAYHSPADQLLSTLAGKCLGKKVVLRKFGPHNSFSKPERLCFRLAYPLSDAIVTVFSGGVAELRALGVPERKIFHIPNGKPFLDVARFRAGARKRLGLGEKDIAIGQVARMDPGKGQHILVKAFSRIAKSRGDVRLILTCSPGTDPYKSLVEGLIRRHGLGERVSLLEYEGDVRWMLAALDIFAHPAVTDALPGAVIEAAAAGLPVVASDAGDTPEILRDCGIVVPCRDAGALEAGIQALIQDAELRTRYGKMARERAARLFSEEKMLASYEMLFESLCGK